MMAMPGMFCDAMATRYSGKAMLNTLERLNVGMMIAGVISQSVALSGNPRSRPIKVKAKTMAAGDAQTGNNQYKISQTAITGRTSCG